MFEFLIIIFVGGMLAFAVKRKKKEDIEKAKALGLAQQKERADNLLRTCTGLDQVTFNKANMDDRQNAISDYLGIGHHPLSFETEFPKNLWHIGSGPDPLKHWSIERFKLVRTVSGMGASASFLKSSAILYNANLLDQKPFEIWAFTLLFDEGKGQFTDWKSIHGFEKETDVHTAHDAVRWLVRYRYITPQAAREFLQDKLFRLEQEHPETNDPSPERLAIEAARAAIS